MFGIGSSSGIYHGNKAPALLHSQAFVAVNKGSGKLLAALRRKARIALAGHIACRNKLISHAVVDKAFERSIAVRAAVVFVVRKQDADITLAADNLMLHLVGKGRCPLCLAKHFAAVGIKLCPVPARKPLKVVVALEHGVLHGIVQYAHRFKFREGQI